MLVVAQCAWALEPDDIALVVNKNVPAGRKLAEFYSQQRHIPDGRIIDIALPAPDPLNPPEEITPEQFDEQVVPAIRSFLTDHHLETKVTCLVTFWGLPLRIAGRPTTDQLKAERVALEAQLTGEIATKIESEVKSIEGLAHELDPAFHPGSGAAISTLNARAGAAMGASLNPIVVMPPSAQRAALVDRWMAGAQTLMGKDMLLLRLNQLPLSQVAARPPTRQEFAAARARLVAAQDRMTKLRSNKQDAKSREEILALTRDNLGLLAYAEQVQFQAALLDVDQSQAALDSELALLWWTEYPKARWQQNPLCWHNTGHVWTPGRTLMVTRLDGPSEQIVHNIIATSFDVEQQGLHGQAALDALGRKPTDPYGPYDQSIGRLADLLSHQTKLRVTFDNKEPVFTARSQKDVALYCGWYSLRNYVPPGGFNPGAVGFHVASFELISLRNPGEKGWVRGLLNDGVVATLGPVAEPYLQSFPPADEFFPLILNGKLTLAEIYWRTCPWVSWMQTCIGDPLYRPYQHAPQIAASALPPGLLPSSTPSVQH